MFQICTFFLPSLTDRSEIVNKHIGSVNLSPIDIKESMFETENSLPFNPAELDLLCHEERIMTEAVVKVFKKITGISNSSIVKNADGLLSSKSADIDVEWVSKTKSRSPTGKYK